MGDVVGKGACAYLIYVWQAAASRVAGDTTSWVAGRHVGHLWVQAVGQVESAEVRGELHTHTHNHTNRQMVSFTSRNPLTPPTHGCQAFRRHLATWWVQHLFSPYQNIAIERSVPSALDVSAARARVELVGECVGAEFPKCWNDLTCWNNFGAECPLNWQWASSEFPEWFLILDVID